MTPRELDRVLTSIARDWRRGDRGRLPTKWYGRRAATSQGRPAGLLYLCYLCGEFIADAAASGPATDKARKAIAAHRETHKATAEQAVAEDERLRL